MVQRRVLPWHVGGPGSVTRIATKQTNEQKSITHFLKGVSLVSVAGIKRHDQKQLGEERVYLAFTSASQSSQDKNAGHQPGGRIEAVTMEGCCLLDCSHGVYTDAVPSASTTHSGLDPSTFISQENAPKTCLQTNGGAFSTEVSTSQVTPVCVKLI